MPAPRARAPMTARRRHSHHGANQLLNMPGEFPPDRLGGRDRRLLSGSATGNTWAGRATLAQRQPLTRLWARRAPTSLYRLSNHRHS